MSQAGFQSMLMAGGGGVTPDALYASVVFLYLGEGLTNPPGGTLLDDQISGVEGTIPTLGSLSTNTSVQNFGQSCIALPGNNTSDNFFKANTGLAAFNPQVDPFCLDAWIYPTNNTDVMSIATDDTNSAATRWNFWLLRLSTQNIQFGTGQYTVPGSTSVPASASIASVATAPINTWTHVAATSTGDTGATRTLRIFINGVQSATQTYAGTYYRSASPPNIINIGAQNEFYLSFNRVFTGYMKCVRLTNNVRWTSNFTPPNAIGYYLP